MTTVDRIRAILAQQTNPELTKFWAAVLTQAWLVDC